MAHKRMFSKSITSSDAFRDMPSSSQLLYFYMNMEADDDGFVSNPKGILKASGSADDDLKILLAKRFLLSFESGVVVIKHWLVHNTIQKDRYHPTEYVDEKKTLQIKDNKSYTDGRIRTVNETETQYRVDIDKEKKKIAAGTSPSDPEIPLLMKEFESVNPAVKRYYGNKTQRAACEFLLKTYGLERLKKVIQGTLPKTNGLPYFPNITTPLQLQDKWATLEGAIKKHWSEHEKSKGSVAF